ncbi:MAG TPA: YciI family protein, partial [Roseiarcus sp.]|nr:YciI family protein [Roseiarcus sp.]
MRVMVIVKATNESEDGKLPTPELLEQMGAFNQQLMDAGIFVDGAGVKPPAKGARVAFSGPNRSVTKGPF